MRGSAEPVSTAALHGPRWGARAADWAELAASVSRPAWEAVAEATGISRGTRVLDVGCGSGEFCALAAARGAAVSGLDAASGLIEVARRRSPGLDFRVGAMEALPWGDDDFDVVTGFNAFQFAADYVEALVEAGRVVRRGGLVAICNWGRAVENQLFTVMANLDHLRPPPPDPPQLDPPAIGEPGVVEGLAQRAGLEPVHAGDVDASFEARDDETLVRGLLAPGGMVPVVAHSGEEAVRRALVEGAAPFRRRDGSYRIENRLRYVISRPAERLRPDSYDVTSRGAAA